MFHETLTNDERRLLLTSTKQAIPHAAADGADEVQVGEQALAALHKAFTTSIQSCCTRLIEREVGARLCSLGRGSLGQFILCQDNPSCCVSIASANLESEYHLAIQPRILLPLIDLMLGAAEPEPAPSRPLSEIESQLAVTLVEELIGGYEKIWQPVLSLESRVERVHHHAQQIAIMHGMQEVYLARYEICCGIATGWLELSLPWQATRHIRGRLDANYRNGLAALTADRTGLAKPVAPPI